MANGWANEEKPRGPWHMTGPETWVQAPLKRTLVSMPAEILVHHGTLSRLFPPTLPPAVWCFGFSRVFNPPPCPGLAFSSSQGLSEIKQLLPFSPALGTGSGSEASLVWSVQAVNAVRLTSDGQALHILIFDCMLRKNGRKCKWKQRESRLPLRARSASAVRQVMPWPGGYEKQEWLV